MADCGRGVSAGKGGLGGVWNVIRCKMPLFAGRAVRTCGKGALCGGCKRDQGRVQRLCPDFRWAPRVRLRCPPFCKRTRIPDLPWAPAPPACSLAEATVSPSPTTLEPGLAGVASEFAFELGDSGHQGGDFFFLGVALAGELVAGGGGGLGGDLAFLGGV